MTRNLAITLGKLDATRAAAFSNRYVEVSFTYELMVEDMSSAAGSQVNEQRYLN